MFRSELIRARVGPSLMVMLVVGVGACDQFDKLLEVETPSQVVASDLSGPDAAALLVRSAANEFRCAHTHYVNAAGNVGWELRGLHNGGNKAYYDSRNWGPVGWPAGAYARAECDSSNTAHYLTLSKARWIADDVLRRLVDWGADVPDRTEFEAELNLWAAYSYHYFGVSMCTVAFDAEAEQQPGAASALAVTRFDAAIAAAASAGRDDLLNAARIGKGRVLLFMGDSQGAANAVAGVLPGFLFELEYSNLDNTTRKPGVLRQRAAGGLRRRADVSRHAVAGRFGPPGSCAGRGEGRGGLGGPVLDFTEVHERRRPAAPRPLCGSPVDHGRG